MTYRQTLRSRRPPAVAISAGLAGNAVLPGENSRLDRFESLDIDP
jgi:hypothetical protein